MFCKKGVLKNFVKLTGKHPYTLAQVFSCEFCKILKGIPSRLRKFLAAESTLKIIKNAFYFTSKALFVLKIFKFLS